MEKAVLLETFPFPSPVTAPAEPGPDFEGRVEHRYTENEGVRIHYAALGEGPLGVMLHGFPDGRVSCFGGDGTGLGCMVFLRRRLPRGSYHHEQRLRRVHRKPVWRGQLEELFCQVGGLHRDDAFHASADPHRAHRADTVLPSHSHE